MSGPVPKRHTAAQAEAAVSELANNLHEVAKLIGDFTHLMPNTINDTLKKSLSTLGEFTEDGGRIQPSKLVAVTAEVVGLTETIKTNEPKILASGFPPSLDLHNLKSGSHDLGAQLTNHDPSNPAQLPLHLSELVGTIAGVEFQIFKDQLNKLVGQISTDVNAIKLDDLKEILRSAEGLKDTLKLDSDTIREIEKMKDDFNAAYAAKISDIEALDITRKLNLSILKQCLDNLVSGVTEATYLVVDLGVKLVNLANGKLISPTTPPTPGIPLRCNHDGAALKSEIEEVRKDLDNFRNELTNHPPSTARFEIKELGAFEAELVELHRAIGYIIYQEDPVINPESKKKKIGSPENGIELDTGVKFSEHFKNHHADLINELHELNDSLHKLVKKIADDYPAVVDHGGVSKLGMSSFRSALALSTENECQAFSAVDTLKWYHAYGWLKVHQLQSDENKLEFTYSGPNQSDQKKAEGSTPKKGTWELQAIAMAVASPALAIPIYTSAFPNPVAAGQLTGLALASGAIGVALSGIKLWSGISSRFRITVARDAKANALLPEEMLAKTICVCQTMSGISRKIGNLNLLSDKSDATTNRGNNPSIVLTGQAIKALSIATFGYDKMAGQDQTQANNARANVEEALGEILRYEKDTIKAWTRNIVYPIAAIAAPGILGLSSSVGHIFYYLRFALGW